MQELGHRTGQPFDPTMLLRQFAANIIGLIFCRKRWDYTDEDFREYARNIVAGTEVTGVQGAMTAAGLQGILPESPDKYKLGADAFWFVQKWHRGMIEEVKSQDTSRDAGSFIAAFLEEVNQGKGEKDSNSGKSSYSVCEGLLCLKHVLSFVRMNKYCCL